MIIALDGPSGAGKGTIGERLAEELNLAYLDTGLLFRAVAYQAIEKIIPCDDEEALAEIAGALTESDLQAPELRSEEIGQMASIISQLPSLREAIMKYERQFGKYPPEGKEGAVLDGRDIGTIIFPEADFKVFVTADVETRALRRHNQLLELGQQSIYDEVLSEMRVRDMRDQSRPVAPLVPADDALVVDTTNLTIEKALEKIHSSLAKNLSIMC